MSIVINEIAWAGTAANSADEWIELYNHGDQPIDLTQWTLKAADGAPNITLNGTISAHGYFLLERTEDDTVSDIPADQIYTGAMSNSGESITLKDNSGFVVDTANIGVGYWPGGRDGSGTPPYASMERIDPNSADSPSNWGTNNGVIRYGEDAKGNPINGTPKSANSISQAASPTPTDTASPTNTDITTPTPTPSPTDTSTSTPTPSPTVTPSGTATLISTTTPTPTQSGTPSPTSTPTQVTSGTILINEIAWAGTEASSYDEWIELHNPSSQSFDLTGCMLISDDGSPNIALAGTIPGGGYFVLERSDDNTISDISADQIYTGTLSNTGETLRLYGPSGEVIDTANGDGGDWPAGDADLRASMERRANTSDSPSAWDTNTGYVANGLDANGNPIRGTPGQPNSVWFATPTPTPTQTPTPSSTPSPSPTISLVPPETVWINEIAWAGTIGNSNDEWIELFYAGFEPLDLTGWVLVAADGSPNIELEGEITPWGFFLLERTDDTTVADIPADQIYTGSLSNSGEFLYLYGPHGELVDSGGQSDGGWPKGDADTRATMERRSTTADGRALWNTNNGYVTNGIDVDGYRIRGTPRQANSNWFPSPTPTPLPEGMAILINEFLPHPKYDWNGDGKFTSSDEFIELINAGTTTINLEGWLLDDIEEGSTPYELPKIKLAPGETISFFRSKTSISLSDSEDSVRLLLPDGVIVDERAYVFATDVNLSWCRLPDGSAELAYPCWPTPGGMNAGYPLSVNNQEIQEDEENISEEIQPAIEIPPGWLIPKGNRVCGVQ